MLGRLEVRRHDDSLVPISSPARRQLLAALLCRAGSPVSASTLIEDLWGSAPPRTALGTLRTHVARLRDDLGRDDLGAALGTEGDAYRLAVGADDLDSAVFERLVAVAAALPEADAAMTRYDEALALWRDDAYAELGDAPFAVGERIRLAELRTLAAERRTDLALSLGVCVELISGLQARIRAEPYKERGWEQLMLAQYRAGRQADALASYRRVRQLLAEDLGVDPGTALQTLEEQILRQDAALLVLDVAPQEVVRVARRCPYLGLTGYDESAAALFVGRERLTSVLAGRLSEQPVVVLTGASGVGKSSLVRAGLIPALRSGALPASPAWRVEVHAATGDLVFGDSQRPVDLVVVDQGEEMFTSLTPGERERLVRRLMEYVEDHGGRLLLVVRSDYYGRLADIEALAPFAEKSAVLVGPLRSDELKRVLVEPAEASGLRLEPTLVETILEDTAGQPEPLPLLSEAMVRTWQRRAGDLLTLEGYRLAGGIGGALEAAAEECFTELGEEERRAARHLLVRMATPAPVSGWIRRAIPRANVMSDEHEATALAALVAARLVVVSDSRVEITHDALLVHWPRLRDWLAERALAADLLEHLDQAATTWRDAGRQAGDLYRGPRLTAALGWHEQHPEDVSATEAEFLAVSAAAAETDLEAARAQVAREVRGRRRLRTVALVLATVLVLAVATTLVAAKERSSARSEASRARRAALAADARRLAVLSATAPDIATSSLLAVAAYRLQDAAETRGALLGAVERNQSALWRIQLQHRPQQVVATPDGSRLATIDNRRDVQVFDTATRRQIASFASHGYLVEGITGGGGDVVVFGPHNGEQVDVGRLSVIDIATGRRTQVVTTAGNRVGVEPVMTPDARWLALLTDRHRGNGAVVDVFDTTDWTKAPRQFVERGTTVALGAARSAIAVERSDGYVDVRAVPSLRHLGSVGAVAGSHVQPAQTTLAVGAGGSEVARIDPNDARSVVLFATHATGHPPIRLPTQQEDISAQAFSPDGSGLAVATAAGNMTIYRARDGSETEQLAGHTGSVLGLAWPGEGVNTGLYSVGLDSQLVSWSVGATPPTVNESGADVEAPDRGELFGHYVLGLTPAQGVGNPSAERGYLVDLDTGHRAAWPLGLSRDDYVNQFVSSPDGRRALLSVETATGGNRIEVWDLRRHIRVADLGLPTGTARFPAGLNAAISADGRTAYSSLGAARIGVFDLPTGRYRSSFHRPFRRTRFSADLRRPLDVRPAGPASRRWLLLLPARCGCHRHPRARSTRAHPTSASDSSTSGRTPWSPRPVSATSNSPAAVGVVARPPSRGGRHLRGHARVVRRPYPRDANQRRRGRRRGRSRRSRSPPTTTCSSRAERRAPSTSTMCPTYAASVPA